MIPDRQKLTVSDEEHFRLLDYPVIEDYPSLLFYIQRNQNFNTVVYEINYTPDQILNLNEPILIHWLRYEEGVMVEKQPLNYIQKKLAYGYKFKVISNELVQFEIVSYDDIRFFLGKNKAGRYKVYFVENNINISLQSVYIFAEDLGVFPQVKWAELFGINSVTDEPFYKKIVFDEL